MKKEEHKILYKCPQCGFKYEEKKWPKNVKIGAENIRPVI